MTKAKFFPRGNWQWKSSIPHSLSGATNDWRNRFCVMVLGTLKTMISIVKLSSWWSHGERRRLKVNQHAMIREVEVVGRVKSSVDVKSKSRSCEVQRGNSDRGRRRRLPSAVCTHVKSTRKRAHQQTAVKLRLHLQTSFLEASQYLTGTMNQYGRSARTINSVKAT